MGHYPAADHTAGTMRLVYNEDSGAYAGKIAEAAHTYNAIACGTPPHTPHRTDGPPTRRRFHVPLPASRRRARLSPHDE